MSDESGHPRPATDPWGNPLPPGTVQQPSRSALPPPGVPPSPVPGTPPTNQPPANETPAYQPPTNEGPQSWWPSDPEQPPLGTPTDAWGQPLGGQPNPSSQAGQPDYPPYPGQPGQPGYGSPKNAGTAVGALVCGILGLLCGFMGGCGILLGPAAIILGISARKKIARSNGMVTGKGLATAGIILGIIGALLSVVVLAIALNDPATIDRIREEIDRATSTTTQG